MDNVAIPDAKGLGLRSRLGRYKFELVLIVFVWFAVGLTINSRNLESFNLQQMGVEAIVERGAFYVEGSNSPNLQPLGDVFDYAGHRYAAKQPGQFMIGAIVYFFLNLLGLNYVSSYILTSALVTFFTASLITAISAAAVYRAAALLSGEGRSILFPLATALFYALGTTMLPYAGIAHHDAIASAFLVIAFYLILKISARREEKAPVYRPLIIGALLGLIPTTSMLVFPPAVAIGLYFLALKRWRQVPLFLLGGVLGLLPLLIYDAVNFGNPFLLPNVAGNYSDTFFHLTLSNFLEKCSFYFGRIFWYTLIILLGLASLWLLPRRFLLDKLAILAAFVFLCGYIFNIDSVGTCMYGPRYLLPIMGLGCIGLAGFSHIGRPGLRYLSYAAVSAVGLVGVVINVVGGFGGAMICDLGRHAFWPHIDLLKGAELRSFPLLAWLFIPTLMFGFFLLRRAIAKTAVQSESSTA